MADCNDNFNKGKDSFLTKITLGSEKEEQLRRSRKGLRERLRKALSEKGVKDVKFYRQGSYAHRTLINPLDGDYDIDDGIYMDLSGFKDEPTPRTVHNWIREAAKGYTENDPIDKEPCVRAVFKAGYHVDLPAYKVEKNDETQEKYFLAKKAAGWEQSAPREMTEWFQNQVKKNSEQLRRVVKYFKAWKDYRNNKTSTKLPNGLTLTILTCEEFEGDGSRDDIAFHATTKKMHDRLKINESIMKPYEPTEDMRDYLSDTQFQHFLDELQKLMNTADEAINKESQEKAAKKWQNVLGDRFPIIKDSEEDKSSEAIEFVSPAILGTTYRGA